MGQLLLVLGITMGYLRNLLLLSAGLLLVSGAPSSREEINKRRFQLNDSDCERLSKIINEELQNLVKKRRHGDDGIQGEDYGLPEVAASAIAKVFLPKIIETIIDLFG